MPSGPKRKLAAIMFTDMVGYTALMQEDEDKARELIQRHRALMKPLVEQHGGEIIQYMGDGTFCRFDSAKEAVNSALEIQYVLKIEKELALRIGIHLGDVVVEGDEVYGDGVNVASRLEPLAEAGGICVSHQVYENIKNQSGLNLNSLGKKNLKNIDDEIEVFAVTKSIEPSPLTPDIKKPFPISSKINMKWIGVAAVIIVLVIVGFKIDFGTVEVESKEDINKLSIAVLPFTNMNADAENEFFTDGITDDILTQLAKIKSVEVISRTSTMQYKNTTKSLSEIGKELGVATILEGSVRRGGNRVRIIARLVDARTDKNIWAETYDREMDDIFAIQSDVAIKIAAALKTSLTPEEERRINKRPTENLEAYDYYLKGNVIYSMTASGERSPEAIKMYEKAIELDPEFGIAYSRLAIAYLNRYWFRSTAESRDRAKEVLDKAIMLEPDSPETEMAQGYYYYWGFRDYDNALLHLELAIESEPSNSDLLSVIGYVKRRQGKWEEAAEYLQKSSDLDPQSYQKATELFNTYENMRSWNEAIRATNRVILINPNHITPYYRKMWAELNLYGSLESIQKTYVETKKVKRSDRLSIEMWFYEFYLFGNNDVALAEAKTDTSEYRTFLIGLTLDMMGDTEAARPYLKKSVEVFKALSESTGFYQYQMFASFSYAALNQKEEAIKWGNLAMETLPLSRDYFGGAEMLEQYSRVLIMLGEYDEAIKRLEFLLTIPSSVTPAGLKFMKFYDPLRNHSSFIKLIAS